MNKKVQKIFVFCAIAMLGIAIAFAIAKGGGWWSGVFGWFFALSAQLELYQDAT